VLRPRESGRLHSTIVSATWLSQCSLRTLRVKVVSFYTHQLIHIRRPAVRHGMNGRTTRQLRSKACWRLRCRRWILCRFLLVSFNSFLFLRSFQHWFFWTWKVGPNATGKIRAPFWSYKLGLDNGWIPKNPRDALVGLVTAHYSRLTKCPFYCDIRVIACS
jgi:hypothetical protein